MRKLIAALAIVLSDKQPTPKPAESQSPFKKLKIEKIERGLDPAGIERFTKQ